MGELLAPLTLDVYEYEWASAEGAERRLVKVPGREGSRPIRTYSPQVDERALFRTFADLPTPPSESDIFEFASEFGLLDPIGAELNGGEPYGLWFSEHAALKELVGAWDAASVGDSELLRQYVVNERRGERHVIYWIASDPVSPDEVFAHPAPWTRWTTLFDSRFGILHSVPQAGDLRSAALSYIAREVNGRLSRSTRVGLLYEFGGPHPTLHMIPMSLLGAIWLQFASAINGVKTYERCRTCGSWFELDPDYARTNRRYCSGKCRSKQARIRREEAVKLHAAGMSDSDIAARLGSDQHTIAGWIERGASA